MTRYPEFCQGEKALGFDNVRLLHDEVPHLFPAVVETLRHVHDPLLTDPVRVRRARERGKGLGDFHIFERPFGSVDAFRDSVDPIESQTVKFKATHI